MVYQDIIRKFVVTRIQSWPKLLDSMGMKMVRTTNHSY